MGTDDKTEGYMLPECCHLWVGRLLVLQKYTIFKQGFHVHCQQFCKKKPTMFRAKNFLKQKNLIVHNINVLTEIIRSIFLIISGIEHF